ncbi:MAG: acylphosphatase [Verrucomicrobiota bacterium]|nr:acylphosphatase [Verrucomicrobiota bacterium]
MISKQVLYEGNVQGVGFRWAVKKIATGFDVIGWVRNLPDGRVELQASGELPELTAFLEAIAQSDLRAHIKKQDDTPLSETPAARGFSIRHD